MFRNLTPNIYVAPQIALEDIAEAARIGVKLIINNRPEDESEDQTPGPVIEAAAQAADIAYIAIPVTHSGFSEPQVHAMAKALESTDGAILAYCRSGTRSALLWALAEASQGGDPDALTNMAAKAGHDVNPIRPLMDMLKAKA